MEAGDGGQQAVAAVAEALGFPGSQPASLLLVESAEEQIKLSMHLLVGMICRLEAIRTLTLVKQGGVHGVVSS
jgi:hypothetical protein